MESVIDLKPNYRITKATNETLAKIYLEHNEKPLTEKMIKYFAEKLWQKKMSNIRREIGRILSDYNGLFKNDLRVIETHNIIPNVLRNQFATLLSGTSVPSSFQANYIALWSGNTTPALTDTQLANETKRALFTNRYSSGHVAYLDRFFSSTEVAGQTFLEVGIFCDGTASANSGYLLSRILINETMGANETLTINATITISSAT
jgi:hypothetical protein